MRFDEAAAILANMVDDLNGIVHDLGSAIATCERAKDRTYEVIGAGFKSDKLVAIGSELTALKERIEQHRSVAAGILKNARET
jgi:hypothetical protein